MQPFKAHCKLIANFNHHVFNTFLSFHCAQGHHDIRASFWLLLLIFAGCQYTFTVAFEFVSLAGFTHFFSSFPELFLRLIDCNRHTFYYDPSLRSFYCPAFSHKLFSHCPEMHQRTKKQIRLGQCLMQGSPTFFLWELIWQNESGWELMFYIIRKTSWINLFCVNI